MPKGRARSSVAQVAAREINSLRKAVYENSELLLSDLQLPSLGLPEQTVRSRLHDRSKRWAAKAPPGSKLAELKTVLHNKFAGRQFAAAQGCRVPELYWFGKATEPPDFSKFPTNFVLKPDQSHSTQGVIVYRNGEDLLRRGRYSLADLPGYMRSIAPSIELAPDADWLVEELIADVNPRYAVPRDFKFVAAGGRVHLLYVVNRNFGHETSYSSWFARPWTYINDRMNHLCLFGPNMMKPAGYDLLLAAADQLAQVLGVYVRIDFYLTNNGPVFGEFTPFPDHGLYNTEIGERALSQLWSLFPDFEEL